ncbi:MAG: hypothetical protein CJBNEKGG_03341 [Prosthecobacter sp.]|nr:hypothetical protein [Prosthecobacter sp.]
MLRAKGHMPAPLMLPFWASDRLKLSCSSPMVLARTPKTNEVATRAMKQAQNSFMSGRESEEGVVLMVRNGGPDYRGKPLGRQIFFPGRTCACTASLAESLCHHLAVQARGPVDTH